MPDLPDAPQSSPAGPSLLAHGVITARTAGANVVIADIDVEGKAVELAVTRRGSQSANSPQEVQPRPAIANNNRPAGERVFAGQPAFSSGAQR